MLDQEAHLVEHQLALGAVLDQRILLGVAAQPDALAHVVHVVEVLAPARVGHLERDPALQVARQLLVGLPPLPLAGLVVLDGVVVDHLDKLVAGGGAALELGLRDADREDRAQRHPHAVPVPLLGVAAGVRVDGGPDHVPRPLEHAVADVGALQDLLAASVHLLALLVEDVVVLDDVLAVDEVELLDLLLGALDPLCQHAVLDR